MQQRALQSGLLEVTRNMNDIQNAINNLEQPPLATRSSSSRNNPVDELSIEGLRRKRVSAFEKLSERELETPSLKDFVNIGSPPTIEPRMISPQESDTRQLSKPIEGERSNLAELIDRVDASIGSVESIDKSLPIGDKSLQLIPSESPVIPEQKQKLYRSIPDSSSSSIGFALGSESKQDELNELNLQQHNEFFRKAIASAERERETNQMELEDINVDKFRNIKDRVKKRQEESRRKKEIELMELEDIPKEQKEQQRVLRDFYDQNDRILEMNTKNLRENVARRQQEPEFFTQRDIEEEPPVLVMNKDDLDENERREQAFELQARNQELANTLYGMSKQDRERLHTAHLGSHALGSDASSSLSSLGIASSLGSLEDKYTSSAI
jgi:hypothetical protein